jgi:glycosyltransferase involved in cell wall biosynthesis
LGISLLEAMACGTPVVATRCGGPEGVVQDGKTGRLVENGNAGALADAVLELLADPGQLEPMRAACVAQARTQFARSVVQSRLLEAFRDVYPDYF